MKIAMMTEGTYPHGFGGVSVWCDQLIRGMPEYTFALVALVATGAEPAVWPLPANVTSLTSVLLWGPPQAGPRGAGPLPRRVLRGFIESLLDGSPRAQPRFAETLRELHEYAQRGNLAASLASERAVRVLSEAWRERWPGPDQAAPTLHDAVTAMRLLSHCLRPLAYPPVQADLAHAVTNGLGILPALTATWRHGTPMMITEHGVYLREQYLRHGKGPYRWPVKALYLGFMRRLCTLGYAEATTITPGNVYNRRWEERLGAEPARIRTVYNGVDPGNFPASAGEPKCPTISWVGRIDPIKDLETLLRAFALVRAELPAARLRLFGAPPDGRDGYLRRCRELAAELGLAGAASFEGRVENIRDAYDAGQIVVLSSVSEGFPYSLIEAMTCGRACVATDVGGVAEAVGDAGLVVPPRNPEQLAQACVALLTDDGLRRRLGAAARARALENFTLDAAISTFDEIYSFLGSGRPLPVARPAAPDGRHHERVLLRRAVEAPAAAAPPPRGQGRAGATALLAVPVARGPGRRAVGELAARFATVCESAVDPLEIACALEFDGLGDQAARDRYGVHDVFALAEELYRRVPRRPAEPEPPPDPWPSGRGRPALHGLLYGLPTACFPAAAGLLSGRGALAVLIAALLTCWAVSQGLAFLGYARLGRAGQPHAARLLLAGTGAGSALVTAAAALTAATVHAPVAALAFGAGLGGYMVGATVLMVLGAERLLLVALAPAVLAALGYLAAGRPPPMERALWLALAAAPALALGLAAVLSGRLARVPRRQAKPGPAGGGPRAAAAELRGALPSAGFGLVAAGLLVFPFAESADGHVVSYGAQLASLPLALSMGAAEWTLLSFRRRTQRLLRTTRELRAFAAAARKVLAGAVLRYLYAAAALTAAVAAAAAVAGLARPQWAVLPQLVSYLALGGAMFVALLLQAFGIRLFPLASCATALALEIAWRSLGPLGQVVATAELFVVLAAYAALVLGDAVRHAF